MKATLEFQLPNERNEHRLALAGQDLYGALSQLDQRLRSLIKYGASPDDPKTVEELAQEIRREHTIPALEPLEIN